MTSALRKDHRLLVAGVGLVVTAACLSGCEPGQDFWITNATGQTLTVQSRTQVPGADADPVSSADHRFTIQPGQKVGLVLGLQPGKCKFYAFFSYDRSGQLVGQDPTPICEDKTGHGNAWIIKEPR